MEIHRYTLTHEFGQDLVRIDMQRLCDVEKLHDIDAPFARFDTRDLRLRSLEAAGKFVL